MLASTLMPLRDFCYITNIAYIRGVKCPSLKPHFLDHFECANSTLHIFILLSVKAICGKLDSKYSAQKNAIWITPRASSLLN